MSHKRTDILCFHFYVVPCIDKFIETKSRMFVGRACLLLLLSLSVMSDSLRPHGLKPIRLLCPWDLPGKNTGVGYHSLLQGIFPTQASNLHLLHWQTDSLPLSHQGNPIKHKLKLLNSLLYHFKWLPHILLCAHNMIYLINLNLGVSILFYYKQWNNKHPQSSHYQNTNRIFHINRIK